MNPYIFVIREFQDSNSIGTILMIWQIYLEICWWPHWSKCETIWTWWQLAVCLTSIGWALIVF